MNDLKVFPETIEEIFENLFSFPDLDLEGNWNEERRAKNPLHKALDRASFENVICGVQYRKTCEVGASDTVFQFIIEVDDSRWGNSAYGIKVYGQVGVHKTVAGKTFPIKSAQDMRMESDWETEGQDYQEFSTKCCIVWFESDEDKTGRACHAYSSTEEDKEILWKIFQQILLKKALEDF